MEMLGNGHRTITIVSYILIIRSINRKFIFEVETSQSVDFAAFSCARGTFLRIADFADFDVLFTNCS